MTQQNLPFIVAQHLNTITKNQNASSIRGLAQLASSSARVGRSFPNLDKRHRRFAKATLVDWLRRFLRKRKHRKFVESDRVSIPLLGTFYVGWSPAHVYDDYDFVDYFTWYAVHGYPQKRDFTVGHMDIEDPLGEFPSVEEDTQTSMFVVIPHRHMRTLMPKAIPTSNAGWTRLMKAVYTRSRTRGFLDPVATNTVLDALLDKYF